MAGTVDVALTAQPAFGGDPVHDVIDRDCLSVP